MQISFFSSFPDINPIDKSTVVYYIFARSSIMESHCSHGLKFSLAHSAINRTPSCNMCKTKRIHDDPRGYLYCVPCDYDKCYDCIEKTLEKKINYKQLAIDLGKVGAEKGTKAGASIVIGKAVQAALGGVVPGVGGAVMMHFNGIQAAVNGDGKGVISAATGGFGGLSGAVIGTAVCPGIGTLIGGLIGSGIGAIAGWGAGKLIQE